MSIILGTVVTWFVVTFFSVIPKKLTPLEMFFVFCADTIFELSMFSILHVNLKYIRVASGFNNGIADLMFRLIELPLLLVASSNILLYSNRLVKWSGVIVIVLFTMIVQQIAVQNKMMTFHHWNVFYSGLYVCASIVFSRVMTWLIKTLDSKDTAQHDYLR